MDEKLFANSSDIAPEAMLAAGFEEVQVTETEDGERQEKDTKGVAKAEEQENMTPPSQEQFTKDLKVLLQKRPALEKSGALLPESVLRAYMQGENLLAAYLEYEGAETGKELEALRQQNRIYQQNQNAEKQAPIKKGVSGGAVQGEDPLLMGFDEPYW